MNRPLAIIGLSVFFVSLLLSGTTAYGHARLALDGLIPPRSVNPGIKQGPCGVARTNAPTALLGGQTLTVTFEETINHPGRYYVEFSPAGDDNWVRLVEVPDVQAGALPHNYTTQVTIPNRDCTDCTIRLIQSMEENPANPSFYYSCADVTVTAQADAPPPDDDVEEVPSVLGSGENNPRCAH